MTRGITRFELWDALECLGGTRLSSGGFVDYANATTTRSLQQVEQVALTMPRSVPAADVVHEGHILRRWRSDTIVSEWPVGPMTLTAGEDATVSIVARALKYRLGECGLVTQPGITPLDGLPVLTFSATDTPSNLVDQFLTNRSPSDALATRLAWVGLGTIEPTVEITLDVDEWNPLQFLDALIAALESVNVFAEWDLRKNGATNYLIDVLNTPLAT